MRICFLLLASFLLTTGCLKGEEGDDSDVRQSAVSHGEEQSEGGSEHLAEGSDESDTESSAEEQEVADAAGQQGTSDGTEAEEQEQAGAEAIECTQNSDCPEGTMCAGPEGCDTPWTCQPYRPCTRDLREYCSCEGETVRGSGSCPPVPYAHRGPCNDND